MLNKRTADPGTTPSRIDEQRVHTRFAQPHKTDWPIMLIRCNPQWSMRQEVTNHGVEFFDITGKKEIMRGLDRSTPDRDCEVALLRSTFSNMYSILFHH